MKTVMCINGSDSMGNSGIQADIRTIKDLGGHAVTAVSSVTIQNSQGIAAVHHLPAPLVVGQVRAVYEEVHPSAVKVGMVGDPEAIRGIRSEIVGCRHIVCSPVIHSSYGARLMTDEAIRAYVQHLLPISTLLIVKCSDAEIILGRRISTDGDMRSAAAMLQEMGAQWVLLRGGTYAEGRIAALLAGPESHHDDSVSLFSSVNISGWQRHGVGGTLSTAIASRMALGDDVSTAVANAHSYMHCQVVYAAAHPQSLQPHHLYDRFMSLLSQHYAHAHDVAFYATQLSITTRYLSQITHTVCGRPPKQIIDHHLVSHAQQLLATTPLTIQQIALSLGFASQKSFAKFFKQKTGNTPTMHRRSASSSSDPLPHLCHDTSSVPR